MKRIITSDETWAYEFDMGASQQSSKWCLKDEPNRKKTDCDERAKATRLAVYQRYMDKRWNARTRLFFQKDVFLN